MKSPIRLAVWFAVVAASVAVGSYLSNAPVDTAAAPPATTAKFVFLAGGSDPYWELCIAGAKHGGEQLGAEVEVKMPGGEGEQGLKEQLGWLSEIDNESIDGVALGPIDPERETTLINSVAEKTTVVTVDSDAPSSRRMFYVGSSNFEAGSIAAGMVRDALPNGGKVAVLLASFAKTNAAERVQGFEEALLGSGESENANSADQGGASYSIIDTYMDQGDYDRCRKNIRQALKDHADLGAIVCTFGYHGPLALETLASIEGGDAVKLIAFDEDERVLSGIVDGRVHATIAQDPFMFGYEAIRRLNEVRSGQYLSLPVARRVDVGVHCIPVDKNNLDEFRARLAQQLGDSAGSAK